VSCVRVIIYWLSYTTQGCMRAGFKCAFVQEDG
jgi:hypothetical protein